MKNLLYRQILFTSKSFVLRRKDYDKNTFCMPREYLQKSDG